MVVPSRAMLQEHVPDTCTTIQEQTEYMKTWVKEFIALYKKRMKYSKVDMSNPPGQDAGERWDFDTLMDMIYSFWILTPVASTHPKHDVLKDNGICYMCTCPDFLHYHRCKHSVGFSLYMKEVTVPKRFSTKVAGKRKAPAGESM